MAWLRRFLGVLVLLLATGVFIACVAGIIAVWVLRPAASDRVQKIAAGLDVGLRRVSAATQKIRQALDRARADVIRVHKESADLGGSPQERRRASRTLRTLLQKRVGPNLDDLSGRLATLSDAAVAATALLQSVPELPSGRIGRLEPGELDRWTDHARQLSAGLRRLETLIGDPDQEAAGREVTDATGEVDRVLQRCQATVDDWQADLDSVQTQLPQVEEKILNWLTPAAIGVTLLGAWVALCQVSMSVHACQWIRSRQDPYRGTTLP
jgi:hypothetical protein